VPDWIFADVQKHFFVYIPHVGADDLLYPLGESPLVSHPKVASVAAVLHSNLQATALAAGTPHFTALFGAFEGRNAAIEELLRLAQSGSMAHLSASNALLLGDIGAPAQKSLRVFQLLHEQKISIDAFQALHRQAAAMIWGAFEVFASDLLTVLCAADAAAVESLTLLEDGRWRRWADKVRSKGASLPSVARTVSERPYVNLRAIRTVFPALLPSAVQTLSSLSSPVLTIVSERRHVLMHRAGIADERYVDRSGDTVTVGSRIKVTADDIREYFSHVVRAAVAMARAASDQLLAQAS